MGDPMPEPCLGCKANPGPPLLGGGGQLPLCPPPGSALVAECRHQPTEHLPQTFRTAAKRSRQAARRSRQAAKRSRQAAKRSRQAARRNRQAAKRSRQAARRSRQAAKRSRQAAKRSRQAAGQVSAVGILGLFLLCLPYQPYEKTSCQFVLKLTYFLLSTISLVICIMVVAFGAYHYSLITQFTCEMENGSCQCTLDSSDPVSRTFLYEDVADCTAVTSTTKLYVLLQMSLNLLLALVCLAACFIMWKDRYQVFYVGLWQQGAPTKETPPQKV
uniref:Sarcospan n=1 Tax=Leptobrachium leishanense TaxID=445787 RepID=A0A8C5QJG3_9ANUR